MGVCLEKRTEYLLRWLARQVSESVVRYMYLVQSISTITTAVDTRHLSIELVLVMHCRQSMTLASTDFLAFLSFLKE